MRKKSKLFIRSLDRILAAILLILCKPVYAAHGVMPINKIQINLSDGRTIVTDKIDVHAQWVILKNAKKVLWKKKFEEEYNRLWDYAFFVPIKKNQYSNDINGDGFPEIAIATWDGGNNMRHRSVVIFSVKKNRMEFFKTEKFNLEYGEYVYPVKKELVDF